MKEIWYEIPRPLVRYVDGKCKPERKPGAIVVYSLEQIQCNNYHKSKNIW